MGINYNVYVGPYIVCNNEPVDKSAETEGCPNCNMALRTPYCPICGTKRSTFTRIIKCERVDISDLYEAFDEYGPNMRDVLHQIWIEDDTDTDYYISNMKDSPGLNFDPKSDHGILLEEVDSVEQKAAMENFCLQSLKILRDLYGESNVRVDWGVISYAN